MVEVEIHSKLSLPCRGNLTNGYDIADAELKKKMTLEKLSWQPHNSSVLRASNITIKTSWEHTPFEIQTELTFFV